jgi:TusA-related sulfurtransferase
MNINKMIYISTYSPNIYKFGGSVVTNNEYKLLKENYNVELIHSYPLKERLKYINYNILLLDLLNNKSFKSSLFNDLKKNADYYSKYDILWLNGDFAGYDIINFMKKNYILRKHNEESNLIKHNIFNEKEKIKNHEKKIMENAIITLHISKKEYDEDSYSKNKYLLYPPIISNNYFINNCKHEKDIDVISVSDFSWYPNLEGMKWFFKYVYKYLDKNINIHLIGKNSAYFNKYNNVMCHGYVEDINAFLNRSKVFIAPILSGAGVKIKILTALSYNIPIVTTNKGAEGIEEAEEIMAVHDDPLEYAINIENIILNKNNEVDKLIKNSKKWVKNNITYEMWLKKLNKLLENI